MSNGMLASGHKSFKKNPLLGITKRNQALDSLKIYML
jgi:hypothetical protein